ncbi:uncharacterized protein BO80DRAFT_23853 [Aspergillus ibericus CBS 121593]|uniref:Uncharacterized protein n=1 Tax=Aspergillus ibericus CBS 121593 TaxID=1448316 RepID=A0A395H567_9EURO|nr:hypothetical protein BO80DRAFT_23853 [Aspergillus ibericus CBS 121593]RAL03052.1 hypothetical protein BO80DRAFT_23853 [Aspergillus ibericus CBS 121593]
MAMPGFSPNSGASPGDSSVRLMPHDEACADAGFIALQVPLIALIDDVFGIFLVFLLTSCSYFSFYICHFSIVHRLVIWLDDHGRQDVSPLFIHTCFLLLWDSCPIRLSTSSTDSVRKVSRTLENGITILEFACSESSRKDFHQRSWRSVQTGHTLPSWSSWAASARHRKWSTVPGRP